MLGVGLGQYTWGKIPTPRGVMGMAQGATPTPVKPNVMAAMVSWNRAVEDAKNTGAELHAQQRQESANASAHTSHARRQARGVNFLKGQMAESC